jgi:hypothetical protein
MPMVINMQVDYSRTKTSGTAEGMAHEEMATALAVNEARRAAMRSLMHDFSNVMVGLCSMSENAVDEIEPGNPLHDDMEIIRDSAFKARQIIRRISVLGGSDDDDGESLVDLVNWMATEADTLRSMLPKGSVVRLPADVRTVLVNVSTAGLRDYLIVLAAFVSKAVGPHRCAMEIDLRETDEGCAVLTSFADADRPERELSYPDGATAMLQSVAGKLGTTVTFGKKKGAQLETGIVIRSGRQA